jgi:anaerobic selenocysteine-containing dehydrogenase
MAIEERESVCTFDCPDTCSLTVSIDEGRIVKVRGSDAVPYTAGVICNKVARDHGRVRARTATPSSSAAPRRA